MVRRRTNLARQDRIHRVHVGLPEKEPSQREELPQHGTQGPNIDAPIHDCRSHLLGRHVWESALDLTRLGVVNALPRVRDTKVDHLRGAVVGHEEILR